MTQVAVVCTYLKHFGGITVGSLVSRGRVECLLGGPECFSRSIYFDIKKGVWFDLFTLRSYRYWWGFLGVDRLLYFFVAIVAYASYPSHCVTFVCTCRTRGLFVNTSFMRGKRGSLGNLSSVGSRSDMQPAWLDMCAAAPRRCTQGVVFSSTEGKSKRLCTAPSNATIPWKLVFNNTMEACFQQHRGSLFSSTMLTTSAGAMCSDPPPPPSHTHTLTFALFWQKCIHLLLADVAGAARGQPAGGRHREAARGGQGGLHADGKKVDPRLREPVT